MLGSICEEARQRYDGGRRDGHLLRRPWGLESDSIDACSAADQPCGSEDAQVDAIATLMPTPGVKYVSLTRIAAIYRSADFLPSLRCDAVVKR